MMPSLSRQLVGIAYRAAKQRTIMPRMTKSASRSWKASSVMEERLRFVARLPDGEAMTDVCREFGISRKTGYKIFDRYKEHGLEALSDRVSRSSRHVRRGCGGRESAVRRAAPTRTAKWCGPGAPKLWRQVLRRMSARRRWQTRGFTEESAYKP